MDTIDTQDTFMVKKEIRSLRESEAATALRKGKGFECLFPTQCIARYTEGLYEVQGNTSMRALQGPLSHRV